MKINFDRRIIVILVIMLGVAIVLFTSVFRTLNNNPNNEEDDQVNSEPAGVEVTVESQFGLPYSEIDSILYPTFLEYELNPIGRDQKIFSGKANLTEKDGVVIFSLEVDENPDGSSLNGTVSKGTCQNEGEILYDLGAFEGNNLLSSVDTTFFQLKESFPLSIFVKTGAGIQTSIMCADLIL